MDTTIRFSCSHPIQALLGSFYWFSRKGMEDTERRLRCTCFVSASTWQNSCLIDSLLLGSTILTTFQIPQAEADPVTRTTALLSLICALMSLTYGCMYIVRFGMMKNMFHASRWAEVSLYRVYFLLIGDISSRRRRGLIPRSCGTSGCCWRCPLYGWHGLWKKSNKIVFTFTH